MAVGRRVDSRRRILALVEGVTSTSADMMYLEEYRIDGIALMRWILLWSICGSARDSPEINGFI
jgi:hypothetical protein